MQRICIVLAALSVCFTSSRVVEAKPPQLSRADAVQIAKANVQKLKKPLPSGYRIFVKNGKAYIEAGPDRETYVVLFTVAHGGKRRVIYMVDIDKHSRKVSNFTDYRDVMSFL